MSVTTNDLIGLGGTPLDANETTNVGTSLGLAGNSFGELIKGVGLGVARSQLKLTENSADTTTKLAETMVDVIAVQETTIDDAGNITGSKSHIQKLPLLNFIDPAFYSYPQVKIEGHFVMNSFATDTSSATKTKSSSFGAGFGFSRTPGLFRPKTTIGGGFGAGSTEQSTNLATQSNQATAVGRMRLYSQLAPETGLGVPKPVQVIIGPSIALLEGPITDQVDDDGGTVRTMSILIKLRDKEGKPIKQKALSIDTEGALWNFTDPNKTTTEDTAPDEGNLSIQLVRVFPPESEDPEAPLVDKSAQPVTLNVRLGLVINGITLNL